MKVLNPRVHGVIDYAYIALFLFAPSVLEFSPLATGVSYTFAVALLGLSLLTAYPLGLVKMVPFPTHGALELAASLVLVLAPWLGDFQTEMVARNFFLGGGIALFAVWLTTDYRSEQRVHRMEEFTEIPFRKAS